MWTYRQSTGDLSQNGVFKAKGYSGRSRGRNNPAMQGLLGIGPIPVGLWRIGEPYNSERVGPFAMPLYAVDGKIDDTHEPTGRSAFRIHGDNRRNDASSGCVILNRKQRERIWNSGDRDLTVLA